MFFAFYKCRNPISSILDPNLFARIEHFCLHSVQLEWTFGRVFLFHFWLPNLRQFVFFLLQKIINMAKKVKKSFLSKIFACLRTEYTYVCCLCDQHFKRAREMDSHLYNHRIYKAVSGDSVWKKTLHCFGCERNFDTYRQYRRHFLLPL